MLNLTPENMLALVGDSDSADAYLRLIQFLPTLTKAAKSLGYDRVQLTSMSRSHSRGPCFDLIKHGKLYSIDVRFTLHRGADVIQFYLAHAPGVLASSMTQGCELNIKEATRLTTRVAKLLLEALPIWVDLAQKRTARIRFRSEAEKAAEELAQQISARLGEGFRAYPDPRDRVHVLFGGKDFGGAMIQNGQAEYYLNELKIPEETFFAIAKLISGTPA